MKKITIGSVLLLAAVQICTTEIITRRGADGRLIITNRPGYSSVKQAPVSKNRNKSLQVPTRYRNKINQLARLHNIPEALITAIAKAESDFNTYAVSKKGAVGIMQLMKSTARQYGVTDRTDANANLEAGIKHLKHLFQKFGGDIPLILAAYNAGEEAVNKYKGVPPFKETKNYIQRVYDYMGKTFTPDPAEPKSSTIFKYVSPEGRIIISNSPRSLRKFARRDQG